MRKKEFNLRFEKINILDGLAITSLAVGLVMAIFYGQDNLSIGIVGALAGYIGGKHSTNKEGEVK